MQCEDPFSSTTPYAKELENNIELLIYRQDIRQCHFLGEQNRAEDSDEDEEEAYSLYLYLLTYSCVCDEEDKDQRLFQFQSLSSH